MRTLATFLLSLTLLSAAFPAAEIKMDNRAKKIEFKKEYFRPPPKTHPYNAQDQLDIYGAKWQTRIPFHLQPFGREMYRLGEFERSGTWMGKFNPTWPRTSVFGDLRVAAATNEDAVDRKSELNTRLNLDVDVAITSTERIHAFFRPFDEDGNFTGYTMGDDENKKFDAQLDMKFETLFFEGDMGAIWGGIQGDYATWDLPFAVGLFPLIFHNGIWFNDAILGVGVTPWTAVNSKFWDISNMDLTFFAANDKVNTAIQAVDDKASIFGFNAFIEGFGGYLEFGYGYTKDDDNDVKNEQDYHNGIISYSHRWKDIASFSYRIIGNVGQKRSPINGQRTADGQLYLLETSWMTSKPYTVLPYANFFFGNKQPQPLAKAEGGILQNVGILFEGDGITNFQTLDATGNNTWGGAAGLMLLFNLDQQLVFEAATVRAVGGPNDPDRNVFDDEVGYAVRYQKPISAELIFRADGMYAHRSGLKDLYGVRTEIRLKF